MKNRMLIIISAFAILVLSACHEITVQTVINKDGTFTRFVIVKGDDSTSVFDAQLPYPVDASWQHELVFDSASNNKTYTLTYSKTFDGMNDLKTAIETDTSWWKNVKRELNIEKQNGFFYSHIYFGETIRAANPFVMLNYHDYLSAEDIELLKGAVKITTPADSARLNNAEDKADQFFVETITAEIILTLEEGIRKINSSTLKPDDVQKYRDSIERKVQELENEHNEQFIDYLADWSHNPEYLKLKEIKPSIFEKSDERLELFYQILMMENYDQEVELPGMLTQTNSINAVGNKVSWKVEPIAFMFEDYTMQAESRVVNYWAFILSGIILTLLVIILVLRAFVRKK